MTRLFAAALALTLGWSGIPAAAELGDDGLHKTAWMHDTFKDLSEDLAEANAEGKRLVLLIEQRGCSYCAQMHEEVFPDPEIDALLNERFFVIQINMFGDTEVVDFDGEALSEREAVRKWRALFTPTMIFLPQSVPDGQSASAVSVATMPGAFGKGTTLDMLTWVLEEGYAGDETFQAYHARKFNARKGE